MSSSQDGLFPHPGGEQLPLDVPDTEAVLPLDMPQQFTDATSYEVRDKFQEMVGRDLLGPWDGETEQFKPRAMGPRERYLVGMLGPKHVPKSSVDEADTASDTESSVHGDTKGEGGGDLPEVLTPQNLGRIWASSMGLSFAVDADIDALAVTVEWGQYTKQETEDEDGKKRSVWGRESIVFTPGIRLDSEPSRRIPLTAPDKDSPGVQLAVAVRPRAKRRVVELTLINGQNELPTNGDAAWLFQARLTVTALYGVAAVFVPVDDPLDDLQAVADDPEEMHLRLLYRHQLRFATGRNVAVHVHREDGARRAHRLETTWLPAHDVPATVAPVGAGTLLAEAQLSMDALATAGAAELRAGLAPLADGYSSWLDERAAEIALSPRCCARRGSRRCSPHAAQQSASGQASRCSPIRTPRGTPTLSRHSGSPMPPWPRSVGTPRSSGGARTRR